MQEVGLTWGRLSRAFWLCFWRMAVFGLIGSVIANYLLHALLTLLTGNPGAPALGAIVCIPISILVLRMALLKQYQGFRIAMISNDGLDTRMPNCVLDMETTETPT